tara:strand:- start:394 stop:798 length:405 start_codon:yes stop_codon:yes gene_type:complete
MNFINFLGEKHPETYFDEQLRICKDYVKLPKELRNCNCCKEHKLNFPSLGNSLPAFDTSKSRKDKDCKCPCRHIARHLCREWDITNEIESIKTSSEESSESESEGSLEDFIVKDSGLKKRERQELDKVLKKLKK